MKYLVAGYGSIGRRHLRNLLELGENDILLLRSQKSTLPDDEIRDIPVETAVEEALAHRPDGVIVANPTALHLEIAIPAARVGCSILLEKPVSGDFAQIDSLKTALQEGGGKLLMGFQYRFHHGLHTVRDLLAKKEIGRPLSFRIDWGEYLPGWHPWEDYRQSYSARADLGGGVALTLCHPLDTIRWLWGEAGWIWGFNGKVSDLEIGVDDLAEIGIEMENGLVGSIHLDYYRRVGRNDMEIVGTEGVLRWRNDDGLVTVQKAGEDAPTEYPTPNGFERNWLFLDEMRHFRDVTEGKAAPACTLRDGQIAEELVAGLKRSWTEKRMIPLEGGHLRD